MFGKGGASSSSRATPKRTGSTRNGRPLGSGAGSAGAGSRSSGSRTSSGRTTGSSARLGSSGRLASSGRLGSSTRSTRTAGSGTGSRLGASSRTLSRAGTRSGSSMRRTTTRSKNVSKSGHSSRSLASRGSFKKDASDRRKAALESKQREAKKEDAAARKRVKFKVDDLTMKATIGTGTFGRVRLCKHPNGRHYAVKILKKAEVRAQPQLRRGSFLTLLNDGGQIIRLKQVDHMKNEVRILTMISHPFIVNLVGHTQTPSHLYMLLQYVPGGELFSLLRRENRFSNDASKFYAAQIVLAFQHLHGFNIVYRDLKPENLLLAKNGNLKITDFGFAKVVKDKTWTLCGTPEYLAPEIIQSKGHNHCVDWWALGILIYEMLCGYPPFYDDTPFGIYQKILAGRIEFPGHVDTKAKDIVRKLLCNDVTRRLGCLRNGAEDVKTHRWFGRMDWDKVFSCQIHPPYVPTVRGDEDTRNFDPYPESRGKSGIALTPQQRALFSEFDSM